MAKFNIPLNEKFIKKFLGDAEIEYCNFMPRSKNGGCDWEIKAIDENGKRKIIVVHDLGTEVTAEEITVNSVSNKDERNKEICRLYREKNLSQVFLADFFHLSQPSVSLIVKSRQK